MKPRDARFGRTMRAKIDFRLACRPRIIPAEYNFFL
jgi:hypothetical protein